MKKLLFIILVGLLTSSCASTYFYSTLATTSNDVELVENGDFLIEKDSVWVAYSFNGEGAPIQITIFNKSRKPLYIDWSKSALILDDQAQSYTNNTIIIEGIESGNIQPEIFNINGEKLLKQRFVEQYELPHHISFIPPSTMISHIPAWLRVIDYSIIPKKDFEKMKMPNKNGELKNIGLKQFEANDTPLKFKSYLTVYASETKPMVFKQEFYLHQIIKTKSITPNDMPKDVVKHGDTFFTEKEVENSDWHRLTNASVSVGSTAIEVLIID